jgi:hypothetical protein
MTMATEMLRTARRAGLFLIQLTLLNVTLPHSGNFEHSRMIASCNHAIAD